MKRHDSIGSRLKDMRGDMPLREAAKKAKIHYTYLSKLENDREIPSWNVIKSLLRIYGKEDALDSFAYWQLDETHGEQFTRALAFAK